MMKKQKVPKKKTTNNFFLLNIFFIDIHRRILELESQLAETANELEKTRNLLFMQYKINRDYKLEV